MSYMYHILSKCCMPANVSTCTALKGQREAQGSALLGLANVTKGLLVTEAYALPPLPFFFCIFLT